MSWDQILEVKNQSFYNRLILIKRTSTLNRLQNGIATAIIINMRELITLSIVFKPLIIFQSKKIKTSQAKHLMISQVRISKILKSETEKIPVSSTMISETRIMPKILSKQIKVVLLRLSIELILREVLHHNRVNKQISNKFSANGTHIFTLNLVKNIQEKITFNSNNRGRLFHIMYPYKQCNVFLAIKTKEVDYRVMIFPN